MQITLGSANLRLLPARAVLFEKSGVLVMADIHLGKSATFRSQGLPIPEGDTGHDLATLTDLIEKTGARQLVVAGDFIHSRHGLSPAVLEPLRDWLKGLSVPVILVEGNHDRRSALPVALPELEITTFLEIEGVRIAHDPEDLSADQPGIAGHLHPGIKIAESARKFFRLPIFYLRRRHHLILPAFSRFTGLKIVELGPQDRSFTALGEKVVEV